MKKYTPPQKIKIGNRFIGQGEKCFIIGEIGSNHNLDKKIVRKLVDACAQAKFDAVKFQIYDPEEAFSKNVTTRDVKLDHMYGMRPWWEVARDRILMPRKWFKEMFAYARSKGLIVFSTVHHVEDVDFLLDLKVDLFKIASIDSNHLPLLKVVAKANKPMLISTGMTTIEEIDETVGTLVKTGNTQLCLLHCVSCYPPKPQIINLNNMIMFAERYGFPVGYSDHSIINEFSIAAVAMGACVIEKHITLGRKMEGPDHPFALEPQDMKELVSSVRDVETALGKKERVLSKEELAARKMIKRSIVAKRDISKGEPLRKGMVKFSRPGEGISPNLFGQIKGRRAKKDIPAEAILSWGMIDKG